MIKRISATKRWQKGTVETTEASKGGRVPGIKVINKSSDNLLRKGTNGVRSYFWIGASELWALNVKKVLIRNHHD